MKICDIDHDEIVFMPKTNKFDSCPLCAVIEERDELEEERDELELMLTRRYDEIRKLEEKIMEMEDRISELREESRRIE